MKLIGHWGDACDWLAMYICMYADVDVCAQELAMYMVCPLHDLCR